MQQLASFPWKKLHTWYTHFGRKNLPWRDYTLPKQAILLYRIWLAEIFLQQTQAPRVCAYFERVLQAFPTIQDLANTDYATFFPYYQGLGYYSRARNMLKTAQTIVTTFDGLFPDTVEQLETLPGIGPYSARALCAFGYGQCVLAWDTNLEKVFSRFYFGTKKQKLSREQKQKIESDFLHYSRSFSHASLRKKAARDINNALMDLANFEESMRKNSDQWAHYPLKNSIWYTTKGEKERLEEKKKNTSFPTPDATIIVVVHQNHKIYYCFPFGEKKDTPFLQELSLEKKDTSIAGRYMPFILPPAQCSDIRSWVQQFFREQYGLEVSVRPVHKKWLSHKGSPFLLVNAQIQTGTPSFECVSPEVFQKWKHALLEHIPSY